MIQRNYFIAALCIFMYPVLFCMEKKSTDTINDYIAARYTNEINHELLKVILGSPAQLFDRLDAHYRQQLPHVTTHSYFYNPKKNIRKSTVYLYMALTRCCKKNDTEDTAWDNQWSLTSTQYDLQAELEKLKYFKKKYSYARDQKENSIFNRIDSDISNISFALGALENKQIVPSLSNPLIRPKTMFIGITK
jgi:hypothetical protein